MIEFGQLVEYITESGVYSVPLSAHALDVLPTLTAVKADYAHVATLGRAPVLSAAELDAITSAVSYQQDVIDNEIAGISDPATIVDNLLTVRSYLEYGAGLNCIKDETIVFYDGTLWMCAVSHVTTADPNWRPGVAPNLWRRFYDPANPEWSYPTAYTGDNTAGAGNGDVVTYQGNSYRCLQSHTSNVAWYPSAVGVLNVLWVAV